MVTAFLALALLLPQEEAYFELIDFPVPEHISMEVGGILSQKDALYLATRRGEIWKVSQPLSPQPRFEKWAEGLQEPLGLMALDGWIYTIQRGELSRMKDTTSDGRMDELETVADGWHLSGNYHEYAFGPAFHPASADSAAYQSLGETLAPEKPQDFWIILNKPFGNEPFGKAPWRGWALQIQADGQWRGAVAGLRSPAGIGFSPQGDLFFTDNQGEWCASGKFSVMETGEFHGHPWGIDSCKLPESAVQHPGKIPDGPSVVKAKATIPGFALPSVWVPWDLCGRSPSGFVWDVAGNFGPYQGQVMVGDQYSAEVFRVDLEKVGGRWQGACFPLRRGLKAGITRVAWAQDGSLWCGMTTRGWPSLGTTTEGIQRVRWTGKTPFDLLRIRALADGFRLEFTAPVAPNSVTVESFSLRSWTYHHWSNYGSAPLDEQDLTVTSATLSADGMHVVLKVKGLRQGFVHEVEINHLNSRSGLALLHNAGWYTLNAIPAEK